MRIDSISNPCLMRLITSIQAYIPANALSDKQQVIRHVNTFLESIDYILSGNYPYTSDNWKERGRRLHAFSHMFINIVIDPVCTPDIKHAFVHYMCTPNANRMVPMRHLYKVLTNIGLLYIEECLFFYLYEKRAIHRHRVDLTWLEILNNMYNANLRYSKTDTIACINALESKNVHEINKYMVTAIQLRKYFILDTFCKQYMKALPDDKHSFFENELQGLLDALEHLMARSTDYQ